MRYRLLTLASVVVFAATTSLFCTKLTVLLDTGTCASGGPYVSARPCPDGAATDALLLGGSIVGLFVAAGVAGLRGPRPGGGGFGFGSLMIAGWALFFTIAGAVSLVHSLTSDVVESDGKLGGIIVGATFLVMGLPALLFGMASAIASARGTARGTGARGPITYADNSDVAGWASTMRMGSQLMNDLGAGAGAGMSSSAGGDSISQLERLQRLREQGALSEAEFAAQKRKILGS